MLIDLNKLMAVNFILCSEQSCRPSCCTALPIFLLTARKAPLPMELPAADVITENVDESAIVVANEVTDAIEAKAAQRRSKAINAPHSAAAILAQEGNVGCC